MDKGHLELDRRLGKLDPCESVHVLVPGSFTACFIAAQSAARRIRSPSPAVGFLFSDDMLTNAFCGVLRDLVKHLQHARIPVLVIIDADRTDCMPARDLRK